MPVDVLPQTSKHVNIAPMATKACCPRVLHRVLQATSEARRRRARDGLQGARRPGRLRLLSFIAAQPEGEACVCHLIGPIGLSQPTVSHHLKCCTRRACSSARSAARGCTTGSCPSALEALRAALAPPAPPRARSRERRVGRRADARAPRRRRGDRHGAAARDRRRLGHHGRAARRRERRPSRCSRTRSRRARCWSR